MWVKKNTLFPSPIFNKEFVNPFLLEIFWSLRKTLGCLRQKWKLQEWWTRVFFSGYTIALTSQELLRWRSNYWCHPPLLLKQNDVRIDPLYLEDDTPVTHSHAIKMQFQIVTRHQKAVAQSSYDAMAQDKIFHGASFQTQSDSKWYCVTCHHSNGSLTTTDQLINAFCFNSISTKIKMMFLIYIIINYC